MENSCPSLARMYADALFGEGPSMHGNSLRGPSGVCTKQNMPSMIGIVIPSDESIEGC